MPSYADLKMAKHDDATFPTHQAFTKLGPTASRGTMLRECVASHPQYAAALPLLGDGDDAPSAPSSRCASAFGGVT